MLAIKKQQLAFIVIIVVMSVAIVHYVPIIQNAEKLLYDLRFTFLSSPQQQSSDIIIVGITEETLSVMPYRSPVDRGFLKDLFLNLQDKGASAIALDILFDQPTEENKDFDLHETLRLSQTPFVVAAANIDSGLLPNQLEYLQKFTNSFVKGNVAVHRNSLDGVVRKFPLRIPVENQIEIGFAAQVAIITGNLLPDSQELYIDYQKGPEPEISRFPVYPAHTVALLPREWIENKIVLVGGELGLENRHTTPFSRIYSSRKGVSGVQVHAQALSQLLEDRSVVVPGVLWTSMSTLILTILGFVIALGKLRIRSQCLLVFGFLVMFWIIACLYFLFGRVMIEILPATIALFFSSIFSIVHQWKTETDSRVFIHNAFSKYLSPVYVDRLVENPDLLRVGGERREITSLFTDLAGFTPLTESLEPEVLVSLVNEYLDGTCEIVTRHGGMVENIVGDALHVMFNAPLLQENHEQKALDAALELDTFCLDFQRKKLTQGIALDVTRIGINTGFAVVGNYGGSNRLEYTAMGDSTNTAARLESVNKHLGTRICISESTALKCQGVQFRPVGRLILKGKSKSIKVVEPMGLRACEISDFESYNSAYQKMINNDKDAQDDFLNLAKIFSNDPLVSFHVNRLSKGNTGELIVMEEK